MSQGPKLVWIERVKAALDYDSTTGVLTWKHSPQGRVANGSVAGNVRPDGYLQVRFERRMYLAHRLAWAIHTGALPVLDIDHINRVKDDNRIANLRATNHQQNMCNKSAYRNNTSGHVGVYWLAERSCWVAKIRVNKKLIHLGYFKDLTAATAARAEAKHEHHRLGESDGCKA